MGIQTNRITTAKIIPINKYCGVGNCRDFDIWLNLWLTISNKWLVDFFYHKYDFVSISDQLIIESNKKQLSKIYNRGKNFIYY